MVVMNQKNPDLTRQLRVATFYRVSTNKQLTQDDIPSQRRSCQEFYERMGWVFVKEYVEKGVSGFRVSANDRDKIQEAKADAQNGEYDVLLCFMFDRLGRKEDETPFVVEWFAKRVQVWSVMEGQQKFEQHTDHLTNYIRFWQAGGESKKTSMRVTENLIQMAEDGLLTGGSAGYGYKLVKSGVFNKKGKELFRRVKDEETNKIAYLMYDMVYSQGYGANRIAKYLNSPEVNIPTSTGGKWSAAAINFILKNPLYKGKPSFGKKRKDDEGKMKTASKDDWVEPTEAVPHLITVPEPMWDRVQEIRTSRNQENTNNPDVEKILVSSSPLLFVGMIECGYCGSAMTTTYNSKKYTLKDGTEQKWRQAKYRCSGKALNKVVCMGQTIYSQTKIEGTVLDELFDTLNKFKKVDVSEGLKNLQNATASEEEKQLKSIRKQLSTLEKELDTLMKEVSKSITGKSAFKPELLNGLIEEKQEEMGATATELKRVEAKVNYKKIEKTEMENFIKYIPIWEETFQDATLEKKKMMLNNVIDKVVVFRDHVDLHIKLKIHQILGNYDGSVLSKGGRAHRWQR